MIFASLGSGSSGNATFIATDSARILVDCGLSAKRIIESLVALSCRADQLDAIFLTHEHIDHIKGLKRLVSLYQIPVFASKGTLSRLSAVLRDEYFEYAGRAYLHELSAGVAVRLHGISVLPFPVYHDAAQPFGYRIEADEPVGLSGLFPDENADTGVEAVIDTQEDGYRHLCVGVMTDTGTYDETILGSLRGLDALLLEANHDLEMLSHGPYPAALKHRILSDKGHLSNLSSGKLLSRIWHPGLRQVLLGHLSKDNNIPELARRTVLETLCLELSKQYGREAETGDNGEPCLTGIRLPVISAAPQNGISMIVRL